MPFGSEVKSVRTHRCEPADPGSRTGRIRADTQSLQRGRRHRDLHLAGDGVRASGCRRRPFTSIVLMTDGENTTGSGAGHFDGFYRRTARAAEAHPVFPILFGDSDRNELGHIAELTGGRLFDARKGSLDGAFEEIRGYQ